MANVLFITFLTLSLVLFQTVILPSFSWFSQCFDLMIMNILFLSLVYSHYAVILAIIFIGAIMDSISGVPFFYHIFSYLWIYLIVQLFKQLVFQRSVVFIIIISLVSVLIQHGLLLFSVFIQQGKYALGQMDLPLMAKQLIWGGILIPPGVWLINILGQNWMYMAKTLKKQFARKDRG